MATNTELAEKIVKLNKAINSPSTPEGMKKGMQETVAKLQAEIDKEGSSGKEPSQKKKSNIAGKSEQATKITDRAKEIRDADGNKQKWTAYMKQAWDEHHKANGTVAKGKGGKKGATPAPAPKKDRTPSGMSEKECEELLAKLKTDRAKAKKRVAKRAAQGKPAEKTVHETVRSTVKAVAGKVDKVVKRGKVVTQREAKAISNDIIALAKSAMRGIPTVTVRKQFITNICKQLTAMANSGKKFAEGGNTDGGEYQAVWVNTQTGKKEAKVIKASSYLEATQKAKSDTSLGLDWMLENVHDKFADGGQVSYYDETPQLYGVGEFKFEEGGETEKKKSNENIEGKESEFAAGGNVVKKASGYNVVGKNGEGILFTKRDFDEVHTESEAIKWWKDRGYKHNKEAEKEGNGGRFLKEYEFFIQPTHSYNKTLPKSKFATGGDVAKFNEFVKGIPIFKDVEAFQKYLRKNNKAPDYIKIGNLFYTMDSYDGEGKEIVYGNKTHQKSLFVETEDRYDKEIGFSDAKVTEEDFLSERIGFPYLDTEIESNKKADGGDVDNDFYAAGGTLSDLKRKLKLGTAVKLINFNGQTAENTPPEKRSKNLDVTRYVVKVQTNAVVFSPDKNAKDGSWWNFPPASLVEITDKGFKVYGEGVRELNEDEKRIMANAPKDAKQDEIDALSDGSTMYYRRKNYYENSGYGYLYNGGWEKGLHYDSNRNNVIDKSMRGDIALEYEFVNPTMADGGDIDNDFYARGGVIKKTYFPDEIEHRGKIYVADISLSSYQAQGIKKPMPKDYIIVEVLSKNLKGKTDLYGRLYRPSKWIFVPKEGEKMADGGNLLDVLTTKKASTLIGEIIRWKAPADPSNAPYGGVSIIKEINEGYHPLVCETIEGDDLKYAFVSDGAFNYSDAGREITFAIAI